MFSKLCMPLPTLTGPHLSSPGLAPLSTETPLAHECPPSPRVFTYCRNINFCIGMNVSSEILWIQIVESFYAYHFPELSWMPAQVIPDLVELWSSIFDSCPVSYLAFNLHHLFSVHPPKVWNYFKIFSVFLSSRLTFSKEKPPPSCRFTWDSDNYRWLNKKRLIAASYLRGNCTIKGKHDTLDCIL